MADANRSWKPFFLSDDVPKPAGAYSPAVRAGDFVFISGQVPRDPVTGKLPGDDIESQVHQVLANVKQALAAAGATLDHVVCVTAYLADVDDWSKFNDIYKATFRPPYPTRTAIGSDLRGILVEISAVAYLGKG